MDKCLGGCKHEGSANLHYKTLKTEQITNNQGGVSSLNWGVFTPSRGGVKISLPGGCCGLFIDKPVLYSSEYCNERYETKCDVII